MKDITLDAGTLMFSAEDMTATGLLIPFGVAARTNVGTVEFSAGVVTLPTDTTGMSLNVEHRREDVVGGLSRAWEQDTGVFGTFKFADTPAGRQAFADAKSGKRKNLSAEVSNVRVSGGKAQPGATLFAAAVCETPAFPGATLLAAAPDTESELLEKDAVDADPEHISLEAEILPVDITVTTPAGETATYEPTSDQDEEPTTPEETMTASAPAGTPATLLAGAPTPPPAAAAPTDVDLGSLFASMAKVKEMAKIGGTDADASTMLAALADIKTTNGGGLASAGLLQPAWVGRLWQGKKYARRWISLYTHTVGGIQLGGRKGYKLDQGTALVKKWTGDKTELPTGTASTSLFSSTRQPYGFAADIAREWWDLEGGADVIAAFLEGAVESYAEVTDLDALTAIMKFAGQGTGTTALSRLVAPEVFPTEYPDALGQLIQGIELVQDNGDDPTSAIVNPAAWKQLIHTPKDMIPEFVSFAFTTGGEGSADSGKVVVKKAPDTAFAGIDALEPAVVVGAPRAIEFREQGSTPIQLDALDIAKGGIDKAVIGYLETFPVREESIFMIGERAA